MLRFISVSVSNFTHSPVLSALLPVLSASRSLVSDFPLLLTCRFCLPSMCVERPFPSSPADAEIKVPFDENTELKRSPFKAWSRSVCSHTFYAYCQGFLPCLFLPFRSIHLHFFQSLSRFFLCWLWLTHDSWVGPQNKVGHPAGGSFPCWVPAEFKQAKQTWLRAWWLVKWLTWR